MKLLKIGSNTKLGKGVATYSLPAVKTCPGRTKHCESICYATHGMFRFPNVKKSLESSYKASKESGFVARINQELLKRHSIKAVRLHPAGDFYSVKYLEDWVKIAKANPQHKFWAYTRCWRLPRFAKALKAFATLPNVVLWASVDEETKRLKQSPPAWLRIADVVNTWKETPSKQYLECPAQKVPKESPLTCIKCSYCFRAPNKSKKHVVFKVH